MPPVMKWSFVQHASLDGPVKTLLKAFETLGEENGQIKEYSQVGVFISRVQLILPAI